ncbi:MAG: hypothetical protein ACLUSP_09530 [Christensenellales bacterium]
MMKTKNQSVEKREKPLKNKIRLHSDRPQIADNESLPEAEKSGSETTGKPVEVCVGSFSSPENYAGVPDGGEVIFCGDEYCPKNSETSRFRTTVCTKSRREKERTPSDPAFWR